MPQVGINLNELVYYVKGRPWVNVANSIAEFFSGSSTVYSTNADGYPTGIVNPNDLSARLDLGEGYPNGTYNVDWVGPANAVTVDGGTNGPTSCTFTKATSVLIQLFRIKADITDLRIWHSSENINETFNPVFLDKMKDYAGVRCMNWASPNHDWTPDWNTRRTRTSWSQGRKSVDGGEVAWEFQCELANKIRKPLWLCIHWRASLSYARKLAALIHKELDPDIPVIFEHGNELWNAAFPQFAYSIAPGTGNMADTDQYRRGFVWHAKRTADIGAVFKSVMKGRQVTVALGAQAAGYGFWDYCRSGDPTGDLAAALPNIDAFAIAPYFGNYCMSTDGLRDAVLAGGVDVIFSQIRTHLDMTDNSGPYTQMTEWKNRANTEGKILLGYEGGQHVSLRGVDQGNATLIAHMASANRDSRMYNLYLEYLDQWKTRTGNSLMFLFNDVQDDGSHGAWGHERYEGEAQFRTGGAVGTNHKYKAVWDWINGTTLAGAPTDTMFRAVAALPAVPEPNTIYAIKATTDSDCQIVMTDRAGMPVPLNTGNVYVDVFETPGTGTWTKRAGAQSVKVIAIGGGNGGGSGRRGAAGSDRYGGGGGGGGGIAIGEFPASALSATELVWVGAGGAGGAAITANDTNGAAGVVGQVSAFGCADNTLSGASATSTKLKTGGGTPAGGGTNAAGAAGTGGAGFPSLALVGNGSSGGAGSNGAGAAATASGLACPGGGGGGGINTSNVAAAGGAGGGTGLASGSGPMAFYTGGAGGAVGAAGEDGTDAANQIPGSGGGGGGASITAAAGAGGNGGVFGAGGGGGGASENGFASGKGGDGANGVVLAVTLGGVDSVPQEASGQTLVLREEMGVPTLSAATPGTFTSVSTGEAWGQLANGPTWLGTAGDQSTRRNWSTAIRRKTAAEFSSTLSTFTAARTFSAIPRGFVTFWIRPADFGTADSGASFFKMNFTVVSESNCAFMTSTSTGETKWDLLFGGTPSVDDPVVIDEWYQVQLYWNVSDKSIAIVRDKSGTIVYQREVAMAWAAMQLQGFTLYSSAPGNQWNWAGRIGPISVYSVSNEADGIKAPGGMLPPNDNDVVRWYVTPLGVGVTDYQARTISGWADLQAAIERSVIVERYRGWVDAAGNDASYSAVPTTAQKRAWWVAYNANGRRPTGDVIEFAAGVYRLTDNFDLNIRGVTFKPANNVSAYAVDVRFSESLSGSWSRPDAVNYPKVWQYDGATRVNRMVWGANWQSFTPYSHTSDTLETNLAAINGREWACYTRPSTGVTYISLPIGTSPLDIGPLEGSTGRYAFWTGALVKGLLLQGASIYDYAVTSSKALAAYIVGINHKPNAITVIENVRAWRASKHQQAFVNQGVEGFAIFKGLDTSYCPPAQSGQFGVFSGDYTQLVDFTSAATPVTTSKIVSVYEDCITSQPTEPANGTAVGVAAIGQMYLAHGTGSYTKQIALTVCKNPAAEMFSPSNFNGSPTPDSHDAFEVINPRP